MATNAEIETFKRTAREAELIDHPPGVPCRLCETLAYRLAMACLPLMEDRDLVALPDSVKDELRRRHD